MHIFRAVKKVPGGLMLVPLLLGALCHTFTPGAGKYFGSFTNGLITGTVPILSVWFFCMGASINYKNAGLVLRKSGTIVVTKIIVAWIVGFICVALMPKGMIQTGFFAGLSTLAIVTSMDMTNGGLYASLMQQYGTKEEAGAFVLTSIESGPLVTMMIPFFAFALGNTIDLTVILKTGLLGILLGLGVIVVTGIPLIFADRIIGGGNGAAGLAASSTAGAAVTNPMIVGQMIPEFQEIVPAATALVATSVVVTSIVVPIIVAYWVKRFGKQSKSAVPNAAH